MMGVLLLCFLASSYGLHECHVKALFSQNNLVDFLGRTTTSKNGSYNHRLTQVSSFVVTC